jgi:hypothetical protein
MACIFCAFIPYLCQFKDFTVTYYKMSQKQYQKYSQFVLRIFLNTNKYKLYIQKEHRSSDEELQFPYFTA